MRDESPAGHCDKSDARCTGICTVAGVRGDITIWSPAPPRSVVATFIPHGRMHPKTAGDRTSSNACSRIAADWL